jgi:SAM-dependent methyltransferase
VITEREDLSGSFKTTKNNRAVHFFSRMASRLFHKYDSWMYRSTEGYRADKYWRDRFSSYGNNLRAVGRADLSLEENERAYSEARATFLSLCQQEKINFTDARVLEIGCGTGFYTKILSEVGVKQYVGFDITDILFAQLKQEFPAAQFRKGNVSQDEIEGEYDVIVMVDVTQHITNDDFFAFAMQNIRSHLSETGVFIVTSWLRDKAQINFHEVARPMSEYTKEFPDYEISAPIPFRDKYIFAIKKRR